MDSEAWRPEGLKEEQRDDSVGSVFERRVRVTPGGVHSPVRAFRSVGGSPVFFARGEGARLIDVDWPCYIDFCQAFGP